MIRQYRPSDLERYVEIVHLNTHEPKEVLRKKLKKKNPEDIFVFLNEDDVPVGFIILTPHENNLLVVDWIDVAPAMQRRGIGHEMIAFAESRANQLGLWALAVFTSMETLQAVKFYESCGFRQRGILKGFYGPEKPPGLFYMKELWAPL